MCGFSGDAAVEHRQAITSTFNNSTYEQGFNYVSAATPMVSGVAALVRAANTALTWRDVKLILAASARKNDAGDAGWETGALRYGSLTDRYSYNHKYGFGVADAAAAVTLAGSWTNLPPMATEFAVSADADVAVPDSPSGATSTLTVGDTVEFTEYVEVNAVFDAPNFRSLRVELTSPAGDVSELMLPSDDVHDYSVDGRLRFGSARHLGEDPNGQWTLRITDTVSGGGNATLESWNMTVYGHSSAPGRPEITGFSSSDSDTTDTDTAEDDLTVTWAAPEATGSTAITSYDVRYKTTGAWTTVTGAWTTGTLQHTVEDLTSSTDYTFQVRAVNSSGAGQWSPEATGSLGAANTAPEFPSTETGSRTVNETTGAGVAIGTPVAASDTQNHTLTYTLAGPDASAFTIVGSSGQLQTSAALDYETRTGYEVWVTAAELSGMSDTIEVSVLVDNVNERPRFVGPAGITVNENSSGTIRNFTVWDPEDDNTSTWLTGDDATHFVLSGGSLSFSQPPDYENPLDADADRIYRIILNVTDGSLSNTKNFAVTVANVNEAPLLSGPGQATVSENSTGVVATYSANDPEDGTIEWILGGDDRNEFTISSGELRFASVPDYENPTDTGGDNTYAVTVHAFDPGNRYASLNVTVQVLDIAEQTTRQPEPEPEPEPVTPEPEPEPVTPEPEPEPVTPEPEPETPQNTRGQGQGGGSGGGSGSGGGGGGAAPPPEQETTQQADQDPFSDIAEAGPAFEAAVRALAADNVLDGTGCGNGELCPHQPIQRWEVAVWLVRVLDDSEPDAVSASRFDDVDASEWWAPTWSASPS